MKKFFEGANEIVCERVSQINGGQDGAIFDDKIFHFNHKGNCVVSELHSYQVIDEFQLDKIEYITPHSNSVCFSNVKFDEDDKFPLLYVNVYNNYANSENDHKGECCVYRIFEYEGKFSSKLVQIIKIGFCESDLWLSKNVKDIRPYGNFVVDNARNRLIAFTMRDEEKKTRFFEFEMPKATDGAYNEEFDGYYLTLSDGQILTRYDIEYTRFMQGAVCHESFVYISEGFRNDSVNIPAIRIVDTNSKKMVAYFDLTKLGLHEEPEFLEVYNDRFFYADYQGQFYSVTFKRG